MKKQLKIIPLVLTVALIAAFGFLFLLINWRQKRIYIPLSDFYTHVAKRINSGQVSGSYLLKVSGKCDSRSQEILVSRIASGNSLDVLKVSGYLWPRPALVDKVSSNVTLVAWPGFSSRVIKLSINGVKTVRLSFESPDDALERLVLSDGLRFGASREGMMPVIGLASGLTPMFPKNPMSVEQLKNSGNLEDAMLNVLRHFGGVIIYAECHDGGKGLYDIRYLDNDHQIK